MFVLYVMDSNTYLFKYIILNSLIASPGEFNFSGSAWLAKKNVSESGSNI